MIKGQAAPAPATTTTTADHCQCPSSSLHDHLPDCPRGCACCIVCKIKYNKYCPFYIVPRGQENWAKNQAIAVNDWHSD